MKAPEIESLVPHGGAMCLLESVVSWDENHATCRATSHRSGANPLREGDRLPAWAGIEYAAQAMAAHSALIEPARGGKGYLASVRDVQCESERLDTITHPLTVHVQRLSADTRHVIYAFVVAAHDRSCLRGRATIVLQPPGPTQ